LTDGEDCYTAAVAVHRDGEMHVFCVDFLPHKRGGAER